MYGYIIIKTRTGIAQIRTNAYHCIYDHLREKGYNHEDAENVASWADLADIGEEYELDGAEIYIAE
jgi:hypothetical protein